MVHLFNMSLEENDILSINSGYVPFISFGMHENLYKIFFIG